MSYDLTAFTDYIGREKNILTKTLFNGGDTGKFAMFMAGIKGKTTIPHIDGVATLQTGTCNSPSGDTNVTEVTIEVEPWTVFEEFCEDDLQSKFPYMFLKAGSSNSDAPKGWQATIVDIKTKSIQEILELTYWQGDDSVGLYQLFDGFIKRIDADGSAIDGNTGGITAVTGITQANVIGIVDAMYVAAPTKVKRAGNFTIALGDDVFDLYIAAQKAANQYHYDAEHDAGTFKLAGSRGTLQRVYGLDGTDRIFAGAGNNFIVGADVEDEGLNVKVWYDETDDKVYMRFKGKSGVQVHDVDEITEFTLV